MRLIRERSSGHSRFRAGIGLTFNERRYAASNKDHANRIGSIKVKSNGGSRGQSVQIRRGSDPR